MAKSPQKRTVLVMGAGYGVGKAIAIHLSRRGYAMLLSSRSVDALQGTKQRITSEGGLAKTFPCDFSKHRQVEKLFQNIKKIDPGTFHLVNCSFGHIGEDQGKSLLDVSYEDLSEFIKNSVLGSWYLLKAATPILRKQKGRAAFIVADWGLPQHNILLSSTAQAKDLVGSEAFVSAKYAVTGLINAAERRLGISTTGIYPGVIASMKPSTADSTAPEYFDVDDPTASIEREAAYKNGSAIPLLDIARSVEFALESQCGVKSIVLKPRNPNYDGIGC